MKKCILLVIVFALLIVPVSGAADEKEKMAIDEQAYGLINAIADVEQYLPDDADNMVTRGEFITAAAKVFKCDGEIEVNVSFTDVSPSDPLYAVLKTAVAYGLVADSELFLPNETISFYEAVKICVIASGYGDKAILFGGYPAGHISVANEIGILSGFTNLDIGVNTAAAYKMLFNTLNAEALYQTGFGEIKKYSTSEGKTVLNRLYDIYTVKGIANANWYTSLGDENASVKKGYIQIEGESYEADSEFNRYIGCNVIAYYRCSANDADDKQIVYVFPKRNDILTIAAENTVYNDGTVLYELDGKMQKLQLHRGFDYIYNGKVFFGYTQQDFVPEIGQMTFIDNNDDGFYDVVCADDYYYMTATKIDLLKLSVYDQSSSVVLDLSAHGCSYTIRNKGDETLLSLADISGESLLAVKKSKDGMLIDITVCSDIISGIVNEVSYTDNTAVIGDTVYKISQSFLDNEPPLIVGESIDVTLGIFDEITVLCTDSVTLSYAYLIDGIIQDGISDTLSLKIYTSDGDFFIGDCSDKVTVDGKTVKTGEQVLAKLGTGGAVTPQLIKYAVNSSGKISKIDLATTTTNLLDGKNDAFDDSLRLFDFDKPYNYRQKMFYPFFNAGAAVIFKIPNDIKNEDAYSIGHNFVDGNYSTVTAYDVGLDGCAKAIVYRADEDKLSLAENANIMLVEKVMSAVDEDGSELTKVTGWKDGAFVEYFIEDGVTYTKNGKAALLKGGDIIRFVSRKNRIYQLTVDFDCESMAKNGDTDAPFNGNSSVLQYQAGKLYSMQNGYVYLSDVKDDSGNYDFSTKNLKNVRLPGVMAIYDVKSGTIRPADMSYIQTYLEAGSDASYIVIKQNYMWSNFAVVYDVS